MRPARLRTAVRRWEGRVRTGRIAHLLGGALDVALAWTRYALRRD
jgi:hypothetical protein